MRFHTIQLSCPLHCRAGWQRKVDGLIRQEESRDRLREVSSLQLAFPLADWDSCKDDTVAGHKEKFASVKMEMLLAMVVNMLVSVSMLIPLWYTGWSK